MVCLCRKMLLALITYSLLLSIFIFVMPVPIDVEDLRRNPSVLKNQGAGIVKSPAALTLPSGRRESNHHRQLLNVQRDQKNCSCSCTISCSDDVPSAFSMSCAGVNISDTAPAAPPIIITKYPSGPCGGEARSGAITGLIGALVASATTCVPLCMGSSGDCSILCSIMCMGLQSGLAAALGTIGGCAKHSSETSSCFPGEATVLMQDGTQKLMTELALGDMVAVRKGDGSLAFQDVYTFGHKDATATARFFRFTLSPINANVRTDSKRKSIELTALHFIPISKGKLNGLTYKRAKDVAVGDRLWVQAPSSRDLQLEVVTSISQTTRQGLYNPFTLGGTVIVNGVVASTHSDWFLDTSFELFNAVGWLPTAYQLVLLSVRMLYYVLGKDLYVVLHERLDAVVDIAEVFSSRKLQYGHLGSWITVAVLTAIVGRFVAKSLATHSARLHMLLAGAVNLHYNRFRF